MRVAVVTPMMQSGETGGAEALYTGLVGGLRDQGYDAEQVEVVIDESTFKAVLESYLRCADLDVSAFDVVISTKAPTYMVKHPNHISYLLHTIRVFYDMFEREYGEGTPELHEQRRTIHALDQFALHPQRVRRHFTNGSETYKRLLRADSFWQQVNFRALHHPPALTGYKAPAGQDHVFLPSRLHRWKRVQLLIEAYKHFDRDVPLLISGTGENEAELKRLAAGDARIRFLGRVRDEQLVDLYANALVVPFVPVNEDYGLITIEAFKSRKPVLTCTDSGEPVEFVRNFETGFVVDPDPRSIAGRLTYLADRRSEAAEMGRRGYESIGHISWKSLITTMLADFTRDTQRLNAPASTRNGTAGSITNGQHEISASSAPVAATRRLKVTVLDMQPIDPPTGGGRMRLLGLYHGLGENMPTTYVGTYDWPGPKHRDHQLSETLREIDVPLSDEHFAAAKVLQEQAAGKTVIDVSFHNLVSHSPEFIETARRHAAEADIVILSHPWVYPAVRGVLRRDAQLVVYESHNVEGYLRATLLDDGAVGSELVREVVRVEYDLCHEADLVLACSHEDREAFNKIYGVPFSKIEIAPNGTFTSRVAATDAAARQRLKERLQLGSGPVAIFIGSGYGPNLEAAEFIRDRLAPQLRDVTFVIAGDVGSELSLPSNYRGNIVAPGRLDDAQKNDYLGAADFAVNPMFSGSGTNIKMFDFMAAGLPVVTTPIGARGISEGSAKALRIVPGEQMAGAIRALITDAELSQQLATGARQIVEQKYSWERISRMLGKLLARQHSKLRGARPRFSVVVATYERPDRLSALVEALRFQSYRDFELIIVDQSAEPWKDRDAEHGIDLYYLHTDVKGAVGARNTGASFARGDVIAFTDDDCVPVFNWLESALKYFEDAAVAAIEGIIISDKYNDPNFRPVTNLNLSGEGFMTEGFMTANLFIRREVFNQINGFDDAFDHPHFREDTDLGWRAQAHGRIPFAHDVCVYHPPQARQLAREGLAERNKFFEKDALLLKKHPDRYRSLFLKEAHYAQTPGFREHFLRGAEKYQVEIDDYIRSFLLN